MSPAEILTKRPRCRCRRSRPKVACYSRLEAQLVVAEVSRHQDVESEPLRYYRCHLGRWHWTRMVA